MHDSRMIGFFRRVLFLVAFSCGATSFGKTILLEAEEFPVISRGGVQEHDGVKCIRFDSKNDKAEAEFNLSEAAEIDVWLRIWIRWDDDRIEAAIDGGEKMPSWTDLPEDTKRRWDLENAEVWHWVRIRFGKQEAGKHTLTLSSPHGTAREAAPAVDKVAIAYCDAKAWQEPWLGGEAGKLFGAPAAAKVGPRASIVEAEDLQNKEGCRVEDIGEAGAAVVIEEKDAKLAGTVECDAASDYHVWTRVWYEGANSFEAPFLHEFSMASYFAVNGAMERTVFQTDQQHWRWEYQSKVRLDSGLNLLEFWHRGDPMKIDKVVFTLVEAPWGQDWFEKDYAHKLPFGIENSIPYDTAPVISDWRAFGSLAEKTTGAMLGKELDGPAKLPFEVNLPEGDGVLVLQQTRPASSRAALAALCPESHLAVAVRGDLSSVIKLDAVIRDASGQAFMIPIAERVNWKGWRAVAAMIPRKGAGRFEGGANDGVPRFPLQATHLVITKAGKATTIGLGMPEFVSPFNARAGVIKKDETDVVEVTLFNKSASDAKAALHYGWQEIQSGTEPATLERIAEIDAAACRSVKLEIPLDGLKDGAFAFDYAVGPSGVKRLYFSRGDAGATRLAGIMKRIESENGAFRLNGPIAGIKREEVAAKYGEAQGLTILADGIDVASRAYADKVGYRHRLRPQGMDLSDEAGWPDIHVAPGKVGIDPELGRVKFAVANSNPPVMAGYVLTGFGVPASAPPQIRGDFIYMHVNEADIPIVDIRDPKKMKMVALIENWYFSYLHFFYGVYGYFHTGHRTVVMIDNEANPYRPGKMRSVYLNMVPHGRLMAIFEKARVAYTESHILELSKPLYPRPVGTHELGATFFVSPDESRAYSGGARLVAWDTSNPLKPKKLGEFAENGKVVGIDDALLLVQGDTNVFRVFEGLDSPKLKTTITVDADFIGGSGIYKGYVYVADARRAYDQNYDYFHDSPHSRIYTFAPDGKLVDTYEDPQPSGYYFWTIDRNRKTAFVNDGNGPLRSFDLSNPAKPRPAHRILNSGEVRFGIATEDGTAFWSQYFGGGVFMADISDPYNPRRIGEYWDGSFNQFRNRLAASGKIGYLPRKNSDIKIVDWNKPESPNVVGSIPGGDPIAVDDRLYVVDKGKLNIYDLSADPKAPIKLGEASDAGETVIGVIGGKAYCMDSKRLIIFDIANPSAPTRLGSLADPEHIGSVFHNVQHAGVSRKGYIYVAGYREGCLPINIFDARDSSNIRYVKTVDLLHQSKTLVASWGDCCLGFCELVGDYFFVPRYGCQVDVYNIADPENPKLAGAVMCGMPWHAGNQVGDFLFVPTIEGLWISSVPYSSQSPAGNVVNR